MYFSISKKQLLYCIIRYTFNRNSINCSNAEIEAKSSGWMDGWMDLISPTNGKFWKKRETAQIKNPHTKKPQCHYKWIDNSSYKLNKNKDQNVFRYSGQLQGRCKKVWRQLEGKTSIARATYGICHIYLNLVWFEIKCSRNRNWRVPKMWTLVILEYINQNWGPRKKSLSCTKLLKQHLTSRSFFFLTF